MFKILGNIGDEQGNIKHDPYSQEHQNSKEMIIKSSSIYN